MNRLHRSIVPLLLALAMFAVSCSGSDSAGGDNVVPLDAPAPGVLYVSTVPGDIQLVTPATADASVFLVASGADQSAVVDVAPAPGASGLHAIVREPGVALLTQVGDVTQSGFEQIESPIDVLSCLDPHTNASTAVAHEAEAGDATGTQFTPVAFDGGNLGDASFSVISIACPRWSADRSTVASAATTRDRDPSSIITIVQTANGERFEVGFDGCGTTPTSFSPDDQFLAVSLTCFAAVWENSGLYLLPVDGLADLADLSGLTKLGDGLYGRTAWHPDGEWIAAIHADAIEKQNLAVDLGAQPLGLQVIEVDTRQVVDLALAGDVEPFSVAWFETALG